MVVVADASPLIFLARLELLRLLPELYGGVIAPRAVLDEVNCSGGSRPGALDTSNLPWLTIVDVDSDSPLRKALSGDLGVGETDAILLALDTGAELLLVDDRSGRATARRLSIAIRGTLGVLAEAKQKGLIRSLRHHLERLSEVGAWLSDDLVRRVLAAAGEASESG